MIFYKKIYFFDEKPYPVSEDKYNSICNEALPHNVVLVVLNYILDI